MLYANLDNSTEFVKLKWPLQMNGRLNEVPNLLCLRIIFQNKNYK